MNRSFLKLGRKNRICQGILSLYLNIMIFSLTLSYFNNGNAETYVAILLINVLYILKRLTMVISIFILLRWGKMHVDSLVLCVFFLITSFIMMLFYPENSQYFMKILPDLIFSIWSYCIIRSEIVEFDYFIKRCGFIARILVVVCVYSLLTTPNIEYFISYMYMSFSNAIMVPVGICMFYFFYKSKIIDLILSVSGWGIIFFYGSRGSFIALSILFIVLFFAKTGKKKVLALIVLIPFFLLGLNIVQKTGVVGENTSRVIQKITAGTLLTSNDRFRIYKYLLSCIINDYFLGHGICADRYYLPLQFSGSDATYAHNLLIELTVDFGILGLALGIFSVYFIIKNVLSVSNQTYKFLILTFVFVSYFQLMYSRSFLTEANFFILFAILLNIKKGNMKLES